LKNEVVHLIAAVRRTCHLYSTIIVRSLSKLLDDRSWEQPRSVRSHPKGRLDRNGEP